MADIPKYLDAAAAGGGNGDSPATAYDTVAAVVAGVTDKDLVTQTGRLLLKVAAGTYGQLKLGSGWTVSADYYIDIEPYSGDENNVLFESGLFFGAMHVEEQYTRIRDINSNSTGTGSTRPGLYVGASFCTFERLDCQGNSHATGGDGIYCAFDDGNLDACVTHDSGAAGLEMTNFANWIVKNHTSYANTGIGMISGTSGGTLVAYNSVSYGNTGAAWSGTRWTGTYNSSDDSTAPGTSIVDDALVSGDFENYPTDVSPSTSGSLYHSGDTTNAPTTAINQVAYNNPPSCGAYEVSGAPASGRIMGSIAGLGGLAGMGGIAGHGGGLAG